MRTILLTLTLTVVLAFAGSSALGGPNMSIPETDFDFGYVPQQAKVSHYFWLHSTGDSTLVIEKVVPG
ncbi:MAG: DUF1573 domain-containing protein [Candidatus Zixiibacteriota bacterium]|nr:MAG: DUF1573 domain-containing protein [candidate division Zixibacteria bacterium]